MYQAKRTDTSEELGEMKVKVELPTNPPYIYEGRALVYFIPPNGVPARYFIEARGGIEVILPVDEVEIENRSLIQTSLRGEDLEERAALDDLSNIREDELNEALSELAS